MPTKLNEKPLSNKEVVNCDECYFLFMTESKHKYACEVSGFKMIKYTIVFKGVPSWCPLITQNYVISLGANTVVREK